MRKKVFRKLRSIIGFNNQVVSKNQKTIINHLNTGASLLLNPVPPEGCGGNIEHFFHFLFDLIYPLVQIKNEVHSNAIIYVYDFGVLSKMVSELFDNEVRIIAPGSKPSHVNSMDLVGMHPACVSCTYRRMDDFIAEIFEIFNLQKNPNPNKILLIERLPPEDYFLNEAIIKGAGATRRSIINHEALKNAIRQSIHPSFEFQNVQLEKMTLADQVKAFKDAKVVIGQHGAGLGNAIWMNDQSIVVELNWQSKPYFRNLSLRTNKIYIERNYEAAHIEVDTENFIKWLSNQDAASKYFGVRQKFNNLVTN